VLAPLRRLLGSASAAAYALLQPESPQDQQDHSSEHISASLPGFGSSSFAPARASHSPAAMELFRSEDMKYVAITMTTEAAHATVRQIGQMNKMHVIDLGATEGQAPSKEHTHYKKRLADCQYWERKLNGLADELKKFDIPNEGDLTVNPDYVPQPIQSADVVDSVQQVVEPIERELNASVNFLRENRRLIAQATERRHTLQLCKDLDLAGQARMLARSVAAGSQDPSARGLLDSPSALSPVSGSDSGSGGFGEESKQGDEESAGGMVRDPKDQFRNFLCGIIAVDQQAQFRRMLYRVSRGNAFARFADIAGTLEDPATGEQQRKSVFYVMVLGQQLLARITRMCDLFKASIYALPPTKEQTLQELAHLREDVLDKEELNRKTEESIVALLSCLGNDNGSSPLRNYQVALQEEKAVCAVMMKAHYYLTMICIEGWVPAEEVGHLTSVIKAAVAGTGHPAAALEVEPRNPIKLAGRVPTYFKLTKFTEAYQGIVDTYGVPRYKEVNPGLFTLISFPFLFGVMYGDIGHGLLLFLAASAMIYYEDKLLAKQKAGTLGEIPTMAFGGRYVLVLMGAFAVYCGIIYNDCLSIPTNVYGSAWETDPSDPNGLKMHNPTGWTYPCGIDPSWAHKSNELAFYNSLKMKMAVILGVCHMLFGIMLSLFNHLYFKDTLSVYYEFLPKLVFLLSTFGYMIWMILYKWCQDWTTRDNQPPNLIQTMIAMFLSPGSVDADKQLYEGQAGFQTFLLLCAFFSVPVMLLVKPFKHKKAHEAAQLQRQLLGSASGGLAGDAGSAFSSPIVVDNEFEELKRELSGPSAHLEPHAPVHAPSEGHGEDGHGGHGEFNFSDELIHSGIHTIEFVLGSVSNTASYLRLWALSLAHAELSGVFWEKMLMQYGALTGSAFMMFIGFGIWFASTFAVLLCMDVLECFLHALRLHWVEFQNKFYFADGIAFEPFSLQPDSDKEKQ